MIPDWKPLVVIGISLVALLLFIALSSKLILLDSFARLEDQSVRQDVRRVLDFMANELAALDSKNGDWSNWDETYNFIANGNEEYIRTNIVDNTFVELRVNLFMFVDRGGRVVFGRAFDLEGKREVAVPAGMARHMSPDGLLLRSSAARGGTLGVLLLDEGPILIAARPILTSKGEGKPRGTLIIGRFLDRMALGKLAEVTHSSLNVHRLDVSGIPADIREVRPRLSGPQSIVVRPLGEGDVGGYALIEDVYDKPALMLRVDTPRKIYQQGRNSIYYFVFWFAALTLAFGGASQLLVYNLAVTRQKGKESEARYRAIVQQSSEGILLVDARSGAVLEANGAFRRMFGYSEKELGMMTLKGDNSFFPLGIDGVLRESLDMHGFHAGELRCRRRDGTFLDVELRAGPVTLEGKESLCLVAHDVTERKKLEEQLRQSQRLEAVGQLAGGVAHDFNNVLSTILGYCGLMDMQLPPGDPMRRNLDQILAAADRAAHLTNGLLAFSRKQVLAPKLVEINGVIGKMEDFLARLIGEDVEFRTVLAGRPLPVIADSGQLEQVLMNLAVNARDAMPDGGLLTIESRSQELDEEHVSRHGYGKPGDYAVIAVSDTGTGMDEATRQRIFEPFFTTKEPGRGTGLGLSIVYGIVKQHNGYINVYSEPGKGTTFRVYLPLSRGESVESAEEPYPAVSLTGTETILLADDDGRLRRAMREVLERFGYQVIEAADGDEAVTRYRETGGGIRLVVLDLMMPGMNGREAYDEIRGIGGDVRALFTSGYTAYVVHRQRILEEGLDFLSKPIDPTALLRKVREVLDREA